MTPTLRRAGRPALRKTGLPLLLLCTSALAGCAGHIPPPDIDYDNAAPAVQASDPPAPVRVVELPKPLPLPGQLKPVGKDGKPLAGAGERDCAVEAHIPRRVQGDIA